MPLMNALGSFNPQRGGLSSPFLGGTGWVGTDSAHSYNNGIPFYGYNYIALIGGNAILIIDSFGNFLSKKIITGTTTNLTDIAHKQDYRYTYLAGKINNFYGVQNMVIDSVNPTPTISWARGYNSSTFDGRSYSGNRGVRVAAAYDTNVAGPSLLCLMIGNSFTVLNDRGTRISGIGVTNSNITFNEISNNKITSTTIDPVAIGSYTDSVTGRIGIILYMPVRNAAIVFTANDENLVPDQILQDSAFIFEGRCTAYCHGATSNKVYRVILSFVDSTPATFAVISIDEINNFGNFKIQSKGTDTLFCTTDGNVYYDSMKEQSEPLRYNPVTVKAIGRTFYNTPTQNVYAGPFLLVTFPGNTNTSVISTFGPGIPKPGSYNIGSNTLTINQLNPEPTTTSLGNDYFTFSQPTLTTTSISEAWTTFTPALSTSSNTWSKTNIGT